MTQYVSSKLELLRDQILEGSLSRRDVLKRAMLLGLSAPVITGLLAACGGDDDEEEPTEETAAATATTAGPGTATEEPEEEASPEAEATEADAAEETPEAEATEGTGGQEPVGERGGGGLLKLLWWQAPTILNSHLAQGTKDYDASGLMLESLANVAADGSLVPRLAAEIPSLENGGVAEDGLSVTWKLREGVMWHDGTPFTANDVAFTYEYVSDEATTATTFGTYVSIESVEAVDDLTVKVNFLQPNPGWDGPFVGPAGMIIPQHIMQDFVGAAARDAPFNLAPVGTGPYKLREFRPGDVVVYDINENYWDPGKPFFDEIELKGGGDAASAAQAAIVTGEVDFSWNLQVQAEILEQMESEGDGLLVPIPSPNVERISINFADPNTEVNGARSEPTTQHPFLQFLEVRQALTYAIDRETIATELYGPTGEATTNVLTAPDRFASPNTSATFDTAQAAEMLEAAGWTGSPRAKDDVEMRILYQTSANPVRQSTQEIIKQAFEEIGIPTELKAIDAAVYFSSDAGNPDTLSHFYADLEMYTNGPTSAYPIDYMKNYTSIDPAVDIAQQSNAWAGTNEMRWVNEEYNELYKQAQVELDPAAQAELFIGMNDLVVNEVAQIPLVHRASVVAHRADLEGVEGSGWDSNAWNIKNWRLSGS
jgi:peptide/nickel transport system substrate-binding protein